MYAGLGGELRPANHIERRVMEAAKLGFSHIIVPEIHAPAAGGDARPAAQPTDHIDDLRARAGGRRMGQHERMQHSQGCLCGQSGVPVMQAGAATG